MNQVDDTTLSSAETLTRVIYTSLSIHFDRRLLESLSARHSETALTSSNHRRIHYALTENVRCLNCPIGCAFNWYCLKYSTWLLRIVFIVSYGNLCSFAPSMMSFSRYSTQCPAKISAMAHLCIANLETQYIRRDIVAFQL